MKRSLVLSLFLHACVLLLLIGYAYRTPAPAPPKFGQTVWMIEGGKSSSSGSKKSRNSTKKAPPSSPSDSSRSESKSSKQKNPAIPQYNFGLTPRSNKNETGGSDSPSKESSDPGTGEGSGKGKWGDGYDTADGMDVAREGKLYPFFEAIWKRIDRVVIYPEDFTRQRIQGTVDVQLQVDRRGVFTGEILESRGPEPLLNTFILATLVHALQKPLPENQWMDQKEMILIFHFDFSLFGPGYVPVKDQTQHHFKNVLSFRREAYVDPKLNQEIQKFFTRYMPPIIILPGAVYIDLPRAYLFFKNIVKPEHDPDELRRHRLEMKKEEMELFIQQRSRE